MTTTEESAIKALSGAVGAGELIRWTEDLVRIPSASDIPEHESGVADYIRRAFESEGIEASVIPLRRGHKNCVAVLRGTGGGRSLMLCGHMDTVPAYGMSRAYDPYMEGENRLRGRGVSDMKGPLAAMMGAMIALRRAGIRTAGDIIFAGVADEEESSIGAVGLLESGLRADAAIVGEAMGPDGIAIGQRGLEWYRFEFEGRTVHGGDKQFGVNAISKAVKFINAVENELEPRLNARLDPVLGPSTVNIGVINGGTQLSTVPGSCTVLLDRRFLPQEGYEGMERELAELIAGLSAADPDFKCRMSVLESSVMAPGYVHQGFLLPDGAEIAACVSTALSRVRGAQPRLLACPCWTDAGLLAHYGGIPTVVYGPGDLSSCHSDREYLDVRALPESMLVYALAAIDFCK